MLDIKIEATNFRATSIVNYINHWSSINVLHKNLSCHCTATSWDLGKQKQILWHLSLASPQVGSGELRIMLENRGCDDPAGWCVTSASVAGLHPTVSRSKHPYKSSWRKNLVSMWRTCLCYVQTFNIFTHYIRKITRHMRKMHSEFTMAERKRTNGMVENVKYTAQI